MKTTTVLHRINAFENAAAMIESHAETGLGDNDIDGKIEDYVRQCNYVASVLNAKAEKLRNKYLTPQPK